MTPQEKNNHYHNILAILRQKDYTDQQVAEEIVLYLENFLKEEQIKQEELQNSNTVQGYSPSKFRGSFRRTT